jgi:membrane-bound lytic murein transglycosylase D
MLRKRSHWIAIVLALLFVAPAASAAPEDFPRPAALEPKVRFWKRVYTQVTTSQGLLHDSRDLGVVYGTVNLPEGMSRRARDRFLDKKRAPYKAVLRRLAKGKRTGLSAEEQRILSLFPSDVSNATLRASASRIRFQLGQSNRFREGLVRMGRWEPHIRKVLAERGLPEELVALPHVESSFNPNARSHVGASGIWQFTRSTGRLFMQVDHVVDERNDPFLATVAAAKLLEQNHQRVDSWPLALTGYNHGIAGMARAARRLGTKDMAVIIEKYKSRTFGFASRNFYVSFLAASEINQNPEAYFGAITKDPPENPEIVELPHYYKVSTLAGAFGVPKSALVENNPALRDPVWSEQKYVPRGYPLRVPRDPLRAAPRVILASIGEGQQYAQQIRDVRYKVRRGDTVGAIARKFGVRQSEIIALNGLRNAHRIRVGQQLELPSNGRTVARRAAARTAPAAMPSDGVYRVRRGDSVHSIATRFGLSASAVATENRISNPNQIQVGQLLKLPGAKTSSGSASDGTAIYTVKRGDTLDAIARRLGTTSTALVAQNGIRNPRKIRPGQRLVVPAGN